MAISRATSGSIGRRKLLGLAATLPLALGAVLITAAPAAASAPTLSGYNLQWADDFSGSGGVSGNWIYDTGHSYPGGAWDWGTGEIENMTSSTANVNQSGGNLYITALGSGSNWTSGRIESKGMWAPPAKGVMRIQGSMQVPGGQGYWPAFWTLGQAFRGNYNNWPGVGEIDIMETVNGQNTVHGTLHCGYAPGGPCNEYNGLSGTKGVAMTSGFHTYAMELDYSTSPEQIRWYVDGALYNTVSANQMDATTWANATHHAFFIILNVAMGGSWPGSPTSSTPSGGQLKVDYVAVYYKSTSGPTPTPLKSGTTPAPTASGVPTGVIQAEAFNAQSGIQTEATTDAGGGQDIGWIANGDWAQYNNVNFGTTAKTQFSARVASGIAGGASGLVEVHLDSLTNPAIGSFAIANTGGWQSWRTVPTNIAATTGTHKVYLKFVSGQAANFANVNWFQFA
jgi:hypothetical protein